MGTRSSIGIMRENGEIEAIYCHWDGYLSNNGRFLVEAYDTVEKINELINLGDISVLKRTVDESIAYHRDRSENWSDVLPKFFRNVDDYIETFGMDEEYAYIFINGEWVYNSYKEKDGAGYKLASVRDTIENGEYQE